MTIKESIEMMVSDKFKSGARLCSVISVDGSTCNVETLDTQVELKEVRLQTAASNGILLTPSIGSFVVIVPIADFEFVVVLYSSIDEIKLLDGSFGGLVKVNDLVSKVNALENQINSILTTLKTTTIPLAPSGTYPFASLYASLSNLTVTQVADVENDKILHGTI